jgi:hypothetical protein
MSEGGLGVAMPSMANVTKHLAKRVKALVTEILVLVEVKLLCTVCTL